MELISSSKKPLAFRHISNATDEILHYIQDRRKGSVNSLRTRWQKFNNACMGGIEPNTVTTFTGISGSGKSSVVNTLETDLIDLNPGEDIVVLAFSFEMLASRQVGRKLSYKLRVSTSELYSSINGVKDEEYDMISKAANQFKEYPIYYVDTPANIQEISDTIDYFLETIAKDKWLIVTLDHALLLKGCSGESERTVIADLQKLFIAKKKIGRTSIIQICQMNRNIESPDRINNPMMHYPVRSDISTSDSIFQASDLVIVIHRPEILGIQEYGVFHYPTKDMVFMHIMKNREGKLKILKFINDLEFNNLKEPDEDSVKQQITLNL